MAETGKPSRWSLVWTLLTWGFVLANLFPILWMVWCSLMGNNEILQGKFLPAPRFNDVSFAAIWDDHVVLGGVNGQVAQLSSSLEVQAAQNTGDVSSSWTMDGEGAVWSLSANGGLRRFSLPELRQEERLPWSVIAASYRKADHETFVRKPALVSAEDNVLLAERLNTWPLLPQVAGPSLRELTGIDFPVGAAVVDSLNSVMQTPGHLARVVAHLRTSQEWTNPMIRWLVQRSYMSEIAQRQLFRFALAERFPHGYTRFEKVPWSEIWVNRIPGGGQGTSVTPCGKDLCFGVWWDDFPGMGVFNPRTREITWVTSRHGLPSTAIQHLVYMGDGRLLAVTDNGLSLIDPAGQRVLNNFIYGENGLPYLDGRDVRVAQVDGRRILLSYGRNILLFDLALGQALPLRTGFLEPVASDITALRVEARIVWVGTSEGLFQVDLDPWLAQSQQEEAAPLLATHIRRVYRGLEDTLQREDAVIHAILPTLNGTVVVGQWGRASLLGWGNAESEIRGGYRFRVGGPQLQWRNYQDLWKTIPFGKFLRNSLIICLSVMFISMVLASLASYALARFQFPGKEFINGAILSTQMVPGLLYLIPIFILFTAIQRYLGIMLINTYPGIILIYSAFFVPMSIWILRGFFASIPRELEEAALIDGCSPFAAFLRITVPAALPGILATGIYVFLLAWDELMFAWVLSTDIQTATIPVGIRLYVGQFGNRFDLLMAAATVATLPVMLLFFLMQRHIVSGLTGGAVKG